MAAQQFFELLSVGGRNLGVNETLNRQLAVGSFQHRASGIVELETIVVMSRLD